MANAPHPAFTLLSSGTGSRALARRTSWCMPPLSQARPRSDRPDSCEEVVLGPRRLDVAGDQLEVLGGPDLGLDGVRDGEPGTVGVDLGGMGQERLVADPEVVGARDPRGDPVLPAL